MGTPRLLIIALFLLALFLRVIFIMPPYVTNDSVVFFSLAEQLQDGKVYVDDYRFPGDRFYPQPFYSLVLVAGNFIFSDWVVTASVLNLLLGSLAVVLVFVLGRALFDDLIGFTAAVAVAFHAVLIHFSTRLLSENVFLVLWLAIVYLVYRHRQTGRSWHWLWIGGLIGLAYLTRVVGVLALPIAALVISLAQQPVRRKALAIGLLVLGTLIVASPYLWTLHAATGQWVLSGEQINAARILTFAREQGAESYYGIISSFDGTTGIFQDAALPEVGAYSLLGVIGSMLAVLPRNFFEYVAILCIRAPIVLFLPLLFFRRPKQANRSAAWYLLLWVAVYIGFYSIFLIEQSAAVTRQIVRYLVPIFPLVFILVAKALWRIPTLFKRFSVNMPMSVAGWCVAPILIFFNLLIVWNTDGVLAIRPLQSVSAEAAVGGWLREHTPVGSSVLAYQKGFTFFGDRGYYHLPTVDMAQLREYAQKHQIRYAVIDSWTYSTQRSALAPLYTCSTDCQSYGVRRLYAYYPSDVDRYIYVYEFAQPNE